MAHPEVMKACSCAQPRLIGQDLDRARNDSFKWSTNTPLHALQLHKEANCLASRNRLWQTHSLPNVGIIQQIARLVNTKASSSNLEQSFPQHTERVNRSDLAQCVPVPCMVQPSLTTAAQPDQARVGHSSRCKIARSVSENGGSDHYARTSNGRSCLFA
jgi:hypothetical protein